MGMDHGSQAGLVWILGHKLRMRGDAVRVWLSFA